jgi:hypothetical protein
MMVREHQEVEIVIVQIIKQISLVNDEEDVVEEKRDDVRDDVVDEIHEVILMHEDMMVTM